MGTPDTSTTNTLSRRLTRLVVQLCIQNMEGIHAGAYGYVFVENVFAILEHRLNNLLNAGDVYACV